MMGSHGVIVTGLVSLTLMSDRYLERACEVQVLALSTGKPLVRLSEEVFLHSGANKRRRASAPDHFEALKRVLDRDEPDYKD